MTDPIEGKLIWQGEGKNRKRLLSWTNKHGAMTIPNRFQDNQLAAELRDDQASEIDVYLELEGGQPRRIRALGKEWQEIQNTARSAPIERLERTAPLGQSDNRARENNRSDERGFQSRRDNMQNTQTTNRIPPGEFHNPYNFVPAIQRPNETLGELGDRSPSGHDRFIGDKLSGKLSVKMTVETPLLLMDTARVEVQGNNNDYAEKDHKTFPVRVGTDGKPDINPTAIKGMLRSAYEAVTNSRLSVFKGHDERLAFRMESTEGAMSVPARVENGKIVLYTGTADISAQGRPLNETGRENNATLCAAWLPMSISQRHGKKLFAWLERIQHINRKRHNPDFKYWRVSKIADSKADLGSKPEPNRGGQYHQPLGEFIEAEGFVCNTGDNIKNKHDERFFFIYGKNFDEIIKIDFDKQNHNAAWERLIKNYRQEHSENNGKIKEPPQAERFGTTVTLEWSRHIQRTHFDETSKDTTLKAENLANSPLCYARVNYNDTTDKWEVLELYPVSISRRLHEKSPADLLDHCLKPASDINKLSPADRVFGWVGQNGNKNAYRGQVRIGSVECISDKTKAIENFTESVPLQILGQPKPQQGRFYVAKTKDDGKAQEKGLSNQEAGYEAGKGLRGRKVYPHHAKTLDLKDEFGLPQYWATRNDYREHPMSNDLYQEFRRPNDVRDNQNRSVKGWVKPIAKFAFDIHFTNLSAVELGALIWLLSLNGENENEYFHRFGGGKPLGFGSVKLELGGSEIFKGDELKKRYKSLDEETEEGQKARPTEAKTCLESFEKEVVKAYDKPVAKIEKLTVEEIKERCHAISFIKAFLASAKGFPELPTHYPRTKSRPDSDGKNYEWFVDNNHSRDGFKLALPNLSEDKGLPRSPKIRGKNEKNALFYQRHDIAEFYSVE